MIYRFPDNIAENFGSEEFEHLYKKNFWKPIYYIIDYRVRKAVHLVPWLEKQINYDCEEYERALKEITKTKDMDLQVRYVQAWVMKNITYIADQRKWKTPEYWEPAENVLQTRMGDCESGAVTMYVLCRKLGIPSYRLMIMAGDVQVGRAAQTGGHAWLCYKSFNYPLNWSFIDWCYYPDVRDFEKRHKYLVVGSKIASPSDTKYKTMWFCFNEDTSFKYLRTKV